MSRIFKFGGASVKDSESIKNLAKIIKENLDDHLLIIISAMGKTTNKLEILARLVIEGHDYDKELKEIVDYHGSICNGLFGLIPESLTIKIKELEQILVEKISNKQEFSDQILGYGELLSTTIVYEYLKPDLQVTWLDARKYIVANATFSDAEVDWVLTENNIKRLNDSSNVIITQGYIAGTNQGKTVTLGREGSDYTAAIFGYCLNAKDVTFWKDVPGILNADPDYKKNTLMFSKLTYREATEMAYYGAKVIHQKTIGPLAMKGIPLIVRSFIDPDSEGTYISTSDSKIKSTPCFIYRFDQILVTIRTRDEQFMNEKLLSEIFGTLDKLRINVNLMQNSALTFSICFDRNQEQLLAIQKKLKKKYIITYNDSLELATIKNYTNEAIVELPMMDEVILEQKTRSNYQVLFKTKREMNHPI